MVLPVKRIENAGSLAVICLVPEIICFPAVHEGLASEKGVSLICAGSKSRKILTESADHNFSRKRDLMGFS